MLQTAVNGCPDDISTPNLAPAARFSETFQKAAAYGILLQPSGQQGLHQQTTATGQGLCGFCQWFENIRSQLQALLLAAPFRQVGSGKFPLQCSHGEDTTQRAQHEQLETSPAGMLLCQQGSSHALARQTWLDVCPYRCSALPSHDDVAPKLYE